LKICPIYLKFFKFTSDDKKNLKISQKCWKCAPIILKIWHKVFETMPNIFKLLNKSKYFDNFLKILKMWPNYFWKYAKNFWKFWKCTPKNYENVSKIYWKLLVLKMCP
jgi:hypothetical protein